MLLTPMLKGVADAADMSLTEARSYMAEHLKKRMLQSASRFVISAAAAGQLDEPVLKQAFQDACRLEARFPKTLLFALRPALRHMNLHLFKVSEKATYVTAVKPSPIDPSKAVSPVKDILEGIEQQPGCRREDLMAAMEGQAPAEINPSVIQTSLRWLIEKGHVIEFYNGILSVPSSRTHVDL